MEVDITYADTSPPCPSCTEKDARIAKLEKVVEVASELKDAEDEKFIYAQQPNMTGGTTLSAALLDWTHKRFARVASAQHKLRIALRELEKDAKLKRLREENKSLHERWIVTNMSPQSSEDWYRNLLTGKPVSVSGKLEEK